jgi:hypothetical protein
MGNENFVPNPPVCFDVDWKNIANEIQSFQLFLLTCVFEYKVLIVKEGDCQTPPPSRKFSLNQYVPSSAGDETNCEQKFKILW